MPTRFLGLLRIVLQNARISALNDVSMRMMTPTGLLRVLQMPPGLIRHYDLVRALLQRASVAPSKYVNIAIQYHPRPTTYALETPCR